MDLKSRLETNQATIAILGMGYVGLPLALAFAGAGNTVIGLETSQFRKDAILGGHSPIKTVADARVHAAIKTGRFSVTTDAGAISQADAAIICVPTPLDEDGNPDLSFVKGAVDAIDANLGSIRVCVLESTTYPGTTREYLSSRLSERGVHVGYSPEREDPGNAQFSTSNIPRLISGETGPALDHVEALYAGVIERTIRCDSLEVAEMAKVFENTFRMVNIALVNELKPLARNAGIDIIKAIDAAASKPFGFMPFYPGPGVGGHCIPVDPVYLTHIARRRGTSLPMVEAALEINRRQPANIVDYVLESGAEKVLVLGLAYKKNIDDYRESPALDVVERLIAAQRTVAIWDPNVQLRPENLAHLFVEEAELEAGKFDVCIEMVNHSCFDGLDLSRYAPVVIDPRHMRKGAVWL